MIRKLKIIFGIFLCGVVAIGAVNQYKSFYELREHEILGRDYKISLRDIEARSNVKEDVL